VLISVIIPTLNEQENVEKCIRAARRSYPPDEVEIIVADGGSQDETVIRVPEGNKIVRAPRGRASQMNRGAAAAVGEIFVFCHADTRLPEGWREAVVETLRNPEVSGGAFQITYRPARGILHLVNRLRFKGRWQAVHGDRAQFMTRATFEEIGGFPEIPLMEDVEMARALHERGAIKLVPQRVTASSRRYLERGPLRQYALSVYLMVRYLYLGATPAEIARIYRSSREEEAGIGADNGTSIESQSSKQERSAT
jgi:rSAM/selenodomain-associated transferase 2